MPRRRSTQIVTSGAASIPALEWYRAAQARTAIGLSQDGRTLTPLTVDKSGGSEGMQVGEVAEVLRRDYSGAGGSGDGDGVDGQRLVGHRSRGGPAGGEQPGRVCPPYFLASFFM